MSSEHDLLIINGKIFDGTGSEPFNADIGINSDIITRIDSLESNNCQNIIDAAGKIVMPGLIDMHTHAERGLPYPELASSLPYLTQGVTTVLGGADGYGAWPIHSSFKKWTKHLISNGIGTNVGFMVGLGQVRRQVMGLNQDIPSVEQIEDMKQRVLDAMNDGAIGISSGLVFAPDRYFDTETIIDIVREVDRFGGIYHTHIRDEGDYLIQAVKEAIEISSQTRVTTVITHFKSVYRRNWGKLREATDLIAKARLRGIPVYADQYPFVHGGPVPLLPVDIFHDPKDEIEKRARSISGIIHTLSTESQINLRNHLLGYSALPDEVSFWGDRPELLQNSIADSLSRLMPVKEDSLLAASSWFGTHQGPGNPELRSRFVSFFDDNHKDRQIIRTKVADYLEFYGGAENMLVYGTLRSDLEFLSLKEAALKLGQSETESAIRLGLEGAMAIVVLHSEDDLEYAMQKDFVATGSDGDYPYFGMSQGKLGVPQSVRSYATFATKLYNYAIKKKTISMAHAIRSSTSLPAKILGLNDRGVVFEGAKADLVIFDKDKLKPKAELHNPHKYSEGISHVIINGHLVVSDGFPTYGLYGRVLGV